jgi:sialate O-acetylesterase
MKTMVVCAIALLVCGIAAGATELRLPAVTSDGKPPTCFMIAGPDKVFQPATAKIEANTVVVQSDRVRQPKAVRFAWGNTDVPNLCNGEGFPASLFRTDVSPE